MKRAALFVKTPFLRWLVRIILCLLAFSILLVLLLKWVPVRYTPLMLKRSIEYRADSSFYVGFVADFAYNSGLSYRGGLNTNHALSDSTTYGFYMRTNSSGANSYGFITKAPTNVNADIGTNANGEIFVYATSTLYLRAGTYTVFCGW